MKDALVSVIMPVYNAEKTLRFSLEAVLSQTHQNLEIICINDGSTDNSLQILENEDRIILINQENSGQCAAINAGIRKARGDYFKFFDADDYMNPEHISEQLTLMGGRKDVIISCAWGRFYDDNPASARFIPETVWKNMKPMEWLVSALSQKNDMMGGPLWLIPKEIISIAGFWDERLSLNNDFDFITRVILHSKEVLFASNAKLYYRSGQKSNLASRSNRSAMESALLTTNLGCDTILSFENSDRTRKICADRYRYWMYHFFPHHKDLYREAKRHCNLLGGSDRKMEAGPKFRWLIGLFGWKNAKRIRMFLENSKAK